MIIRNKGEIHPLCCDETQGGKGRGREQGTKDKTNAKGFDLKCDETRGMEGAKV